MEKVILEVEHFVLVAYTNRFVIIDKRTEQILLITSVKKVAIEKFKTLT